MAEHKVNIEWQRNNVEFEYKTYDRTCDVTFGGGHTIQASTPTEYFGKAELPNPEELLLAALANCYMQTFLAICSKKGFVVDSYIDKVSGITGKNDQGQNCITEIYLKPMVQFHDKQPDREELTQLCETAHKYCFISNSINSKVKIDLKIEE